MFIKDVKGKQNLLNIVYGSGNNYRSVLILEDIKNSA